MSADSVNSFIGYAWLKRAIIWRKKADGSVRIKVVGVNEYTE